jgi:hypothetical protein
MLAAGGLLLAAVAVPPYLIRRKSFGQHHTDSSDSVNSK